MQWALGIFISVKELAIEVSVFRIKLEIGKSRLCLCHPWNVPANIWFIYR